MKENKLKAAKIVERRYMRLASIVEEEPNIDSEKMTKLTNDLRILVKLSQYFRDQLEPHEKAVLLSTGNLFSRAKVGHQIFEYDEPSQHWSNKMDNQFLRMMMAREWDLNYPNSDGYSKGGRK